MSKIGAPRKLGFQVSKVDRSGNPTRVVNPTTGESISYREYRNRTEAQARGLPTISAKQRVERQAKESGGQFYKRMRVQGEIYDIYKLGDIFPIRDFIFTLPDDKFVKVVVKTRTMGEHGEDVFHWCEFMEPMDVSDFKRTFANEDRWSEHIIDFLEGTENMKSGSPPCPGEIMEANIWVSP